MRLDYKEVIYLIGVGITIVAGLTVYAHANFSTKDTIDRIEKMQEYKNSVIIKRLDRIESKLDRLRK